MTFLTADDCSSPLHSKEGSPRLLLSSYPPKNGSCPRVRRSKIRALQRPRRVSHSPRIRERPPGGIGGKHKVRCAPGVWDVCGLAGNEKTQRQKREKDPRQKRRPREVSYHHIMGVPRYSSSRAPTWIVSHFTLPFSIAFLNPFCLLVSLAVLPVLMSAKVMPFGFSFECPSKMT